MSKIDTARKIFMHPSKLIPALGSNGFFWWLNDAKYLELLYYARTGKKLDLKSPKTFNEKLQWLKIHDRNPRYSQLVDKVEAKRIVGELIGKDHIVPMYGVWNNARDINFENLPNQVVLKCNHDQGSVVLVHDIHSFDKDAAVIFLNKKLKHSPYPGSREYAYVGIRPVVFAEKYLGSSIIDYKFYCFNGEPRFLYCGKGLTADHSLKIDFFDMDWQPMPFYRTDYQRLGQIPEPEHFQKMKEIARTLSKDVPFVRIDLFETEGIVYFSEFTLCPAQGFMPFVPEEYDRIVGDWLEMPM